MPPDWEDRKFLGINFSKDSPFHPPPFAEIPEDLPARDVEVFLKEQRLEDLVFKLRAETFEMPSRGSDSLDYSARQARAKLAMERELSYLVRWAMKNIEGFHPPDGWQATNSVKKVFLRSEEYPSINFVANLLGPRGLNLLAIQEKFGCTIEIRGRGSESSGMEDSHLDLHVHIEGDNEDIVQQTESELRKFIDPDHPEFSSLQAHAVTRGLSVS